MLVRLCFLLFVLFSPLNHAADLTTQRGAELTRAFYESRFDLLWAGMSPEMKAAMKSQEQLAQFRAQIDAQLGAERSVVSETVTQESGAAIYRRHAKFAKFSGEILVQWALSSDGTVIGFFIRPAPTTNPPPAEAPSDKQGYLTRTPLRLPFEDEFLVVWGGRTIAENYHAAHASQRFALDLLIAKNGKSHEGKGDKNEDYYCFGRPILAPAAGTIASLLEDVADNVPGQMNQAVITGNRIVIDHGNGEYSLLAHLRKGSLRVKTGDTVTAGHLLAECGNSGNSSEAHLHYQLQAGPEFGVATALPAQFNRYLANEHAVERGEPVRGQRIKPASAK